MQPDGFSDIRRDYGPADVERLAGSFRIRHTLAEMGAVRLRHLMNTEPFVPTLGALTGNQAVQQVKAGLQAIYLSGWQVAADANTAGQMYPDQSLNAARLAADVEGVATVLLCRTDAQSAQLLTSDIDERDRPFISGERTAEGFCRIRPGLGVEYAIARSLAYAPYADLLWWETSEPDLGEAERFDDAIHRAFPGNLLAYNCSPSFMWPKQLGSERLASFQHDIAQMGYRFQFVTLAGFHSLNLAMFELARDYCERGMAAYSELQQAEFAAEADGYTATRHQREVGVGYFDAVASVISGGCSSTTALAGSTETAQFHQDRPADSTQHGHDEGLVHNH